MKNNIQHMDKKINSNSSYAKYNYGIENNNYKKYKYRLFNIIIYKR